MATQKSQIPVFHITYHPNFLNQGMTYIVEVLYGKNPIILKSVGVAFPIFPKKEGISILPPLDEINQNLQKYLELAHAPKFLENVNEDTKLGALLGARIKVRTDLELNVWAEMSDITSNMIEKETNSDEMIWLANFYEIMGAK